MPGRPSAKHRDGRLGLALLNDKKQAQRKKKASDLHTTDEFRMPTEDLVQGILEPKVRDTEIYEDDLFWNEQLLQRVSRMEEQHEKSRKVIVLEKRVKPVASTPEEQERWYELSKKLPIPQRPKWSHNMSPKELQTKEKEDFLNWRRAMAKMEEDEQVFLTPFEKNLEIWRQLWRVIERSDIVFHILDARNPLMFRNHNLEEYIQSHKDAAGRPKQVVLLLNKADLLNKKQRMAWAQYLQKTSVRFIFFSADIALREVEKEKQRLKKLNAVDEALDQGDITEKEAEELRATLEPPSAADLVKLDARGYPVDPTHIFGRQDLIHYCHMYALYMGFNKKEDVPAPAPAPRKPGAPKGYTPKGLVVPPKVGIVVGMVGYPNVGKSSTINALFSTKRVVVSATPGKTKHFQTLVLDDVITLCDCPGLVFPSFASTREGMICDGILPIATMRDFVAPMDLLLQRIKKEVIEMLYNVDIEWGLDEDHSSSFTELVLNLYARHRGMMTDHNKPNQSRAARELLHDYVAGKLLYVNPPPHHKTAVMDDNGDANEKHKNNAEARVKGNAAHKYTAEDTESDEEEDTEDEEGEEEEDDSDQLDDAAGLLDEEEEDEEEEDEEFEFKIPGDHPPEPTFAQREELFNLHNVNMEGLYQKMLEKKKKRKKKSRASYLPVEREGLEDIVVVQKDGTHVLHLDLEDGIVQIDVPTQKKERHLTKRQMRQQQRQEFKNMNNRRMFVSGYTATDSSGHA